MKDAAPGVKQDSDFDAAGRLVQSRTVTSDGIVQARVTYTYGSHGEILREASQSYWPDGKSVHKSSQTTYDTNSNFTSEVIEEFDAAGKHDNGHQVFHDPLSGVYRCFDWNRAQQKYSAEECPDSEESHEGPKEVRTLKREEVLEQLATARQTAAAGQKSLQLVPRSPIETTSGEAPAVVGIVLPAAMRPGEHVSGSVVADPDRFAAYPELLVTRVTLPGGGTADSLRLNEWTVAIARGEAQSADAPFSMTVPSGTTLEVTLRQAGDSAAAVSQKIEVPRTSPQTPARSQGFESPALCFKREVCAVSGQFSGDSRNTFAAFEGVPAGIVAETETVAYLEVPAYMNLGSSALVVSEGSKVAAMLMVVAELVLNPNHEQVQPGRDMGVALRVAGVGELNDQQWKHGVYPTSNLSQARALVPGFDPQKVAATLRKRNEKRLKQDGLHRKEEKWEESAGMVLVVLRNLTPDTGGFRGAGFEKLVLSLTPDSFGRGDFTYNFTIDPTKSGAARVQAVVLPFLAPVQGEIFQVGPRGQK